MKKHELASYLVGFYVASLMQCITLYKSFLIIINQKTKAFFFWFLFATTFFTLNTLQAQVKNNSVIYIGDNSTFYTGVSDFNFGLGSIATSRSQLGYGVLSFPNGASCSGANDIFFLDGYARTHSNTAFLLPIGQSGIYAPIQLTPSTSDGVDAAYFRSAPNSIGGVLDTSISSISSVEYWDINSNGVNASISLSWRSSSAISNLTSSSLPNLTIVGWNGSEWNTIPSIIDEYSIQGEISSLDSGSISTNTEVDLSVYSAFSLGTKSNLLQVPEFEKVELKVYINKNRLFIIASQTLKTLVVYDVTGKKIFLKNINGGLNYSHPFNYESGVYIVSTEFYNATSLITKKIINNN